VIAEAVRAAVISQARQAAQLLLEGKLAGTPFDDGKEHGYTFEAVGTYRRLGVPVNVSVAPNGLPTSLDLGSFELAGVAVA